MARRERANRIEEEKAAYGAPVATVEVLPAELLDVGERYMEQLKEKARLVSQTLAKAGIPHAVIGGLAVAAQVARVNPYAERNTKDLDILLNRADLERAKAALAPHAFRYRKVMRLYAFMPTQKGAKFEQGVRIIWAGEKVREEYPCPAPSLSSDHFDVGDGVTYLALQELLVMKLTSFRLKDQVHVQDLLGQGLITSAIRRMLPVELQARLKQVEEITERERLG